MPRNPNKSDWSGGLPACIASFSVIEDPRTGGNKLHHFGEVLFMAVSAMLGGKPGKVEVRDLRGKCVLAEARVSGDSGIPLLMLPGPLRSVRILITTPEGEVPVSVSRAMDVKVSEVPTVEGFHPFLEKHLR